MSLISWDWGLELLLLFLSGVGAVAFPTDNNNKIHPLTIFIIWFAATELLLVCVKFKIKYMPAIKKIEERLEALEKCDRLLKATVDGASMHVLGVSSVQKLPPIPSSAATESISILHATRPQDLLLSPNYLSYFFRLRTLLSEKPIHRIVIVNDSLKALLPLTAFVQLSMEMDIKTHLFTKSDLYQAIAIIKDKHKYEKIATFLESNLQVASFEDGKYQVDYVQKNGEVIRHDPNENPIINNGFPLLKEVLGKFIKCREVMRNGDELIDAEKIETLLKTNKDAFLRSLRDLS